jgi:hypothetical protein
MLDLRQQQMGVSYFTGCKKFLPTVWGIWSAQAAEFLAVLPKAAAVMPQRYR